MAELKPGPLGSISGKVGNVIASRWRAIRYVRGLADRNTKAASAMQISTRARFKLMTSFLGQIKAVVDKGFQYRDTSRATAFNLAVQENMKAVGGQYPDLEINFSKVILSMGNLISCTDAKLKCDMPGLLEISWKDPGNKSPQFASDEAIVLIYNPAKQFAITSEGAAMRGDYKLELEVPHSWSGEAVHAHVFFHNKEFKKNSATVYAGTTILM